MASSPDNGVERVLQGNLDNLPKQESTKVRIFLSSTFTDHQEERNHLMREVVPVLRSHFQNKGYEFQIADMRWGVRDDAQNDHQTTSICLKQVENCYNTSRGPYLAIFLGNKYGYRPYPNIIAENEFELLYEEVDKFNTTLLDEWFLLDKNVVPAAYVLQPITSIFPYYNDESEENAEQHEKDKENWEAVDTLLTNIFREAAMKAYQKGKMDKKTKHKYHRSVTEAEIDTGLLSKQDFQDRVFCFVRDFSDFNLEDTKAKRFTDIEGKDFDEEAMELLKNLKEVAVPDKLKKDSIHYCTIPWTPEGINPDNDVHKEYLHKLGKLFKETVMRQVAATFKSKENYGMIKPLYQEVLHHSTFGTNKVKTFSGRKELLAEIKKKVLTASSDTEAGMEREKMMLAKEEKMEMKKKVKEEEMKMMLMQAAQKGGKDVDFEELAESLDDNDGSDTTRSEMDAMSQHLSTLGIKFSKEEQEENPREKLMEELVMMPLEEYTRPLVLFGQSGCGKTALMAKLAAEVDAWFDKPIVKIIRFLGTSPKSNNLKTLLLYLCKQIWYNYNLENQDDHDLDKDMAILVLYFHALLRRIDSESKPLVIILDSLDQLDGSDNAFSMMWLPPTTAANVCIIVSMLPHVPNALPLAESKSEGQPAPVMCLDNARKNLGEDGHFVEVPKLPESTAEDILKKWMANCNQALTDEQLKLIFSNFKEEPQPLHLKLCHDQSKLWKSYTAITECLLGKTIQAAIEKLFSDLEVQHGEMLVSKALGYLTAAKHGLTDTELEDILSLDDDVLQDTYLYHLPPDPSIVRLPPLLWQRVRGDLGEFLVEREADGSSVFNWYHRQFIQVAQARYVFTSENYAMELHSMLADFFVGTWSDAPKPIELYKKKKGSYPNAFRQVQAQPNCFEDNRYNVRKLGELPHHLTLSGRADDLLKMTLSDLDWLYTKAKAKGIREVLNDLQFAKTTFRTQGMTEDMEVMKEIEQLYKILIMRSDALWKDAGSLPVQLLGQLGMNKEPETPGLAKLLQECWTWCDMTTSPLLAPTTRCLPYPEPSVKMSLNICISNLGDPSENEVKCAVSENGKVLYAVDKQKLGLGDLLKVFDLTLENELIRIVPLKGMDVKTIKSVANKYLHLVLYKRRDKYEPDLIFKLYNQSLVLPSGVKEDDQVRGVSPSGDMAFVLHPKLDDKQEETGEDRMSALFGRKKLKQMEPFLVNLDSGQRSPFPEETAEALTKDLVKHALFSEDGKYLVVVVAKNGGVVIDVENKKMVATLLEMKEQMFAFSRGEAEHHIAEQTTRILSNNKVLIASPKYEEYVSLCDLQTGEKIHDLWRKGYDKYDWEKMAVNKEESLVAMATSSSGITNGNVQKDCVVWNLSSGKLHAVIPNRKGWFSWIGFCGPEDEYIICCHDYSKQIVDLWYIGTVNDPLPYPEAIHLLDLNSVSQVVRFFSNVLDGSYFVTASVDNIVMFHNMKYIDAECKSILPEKLENLKNKYADGANQEELDKIMGVVEKDEDDDFWNPRTKANVDSDGKKSAAESNIFDLGGDEEEGAGDEDAAAEGDAVREASETTGGNNDDIDTKVEGHIDNTQDEKIDTDDAVFKTEAEKDGCEMRSGSTILDDQGQVNDLENIPEESINPVGDIKRDDANEQVENKGEVSGDGDNQPTGTTKMEDLKSGEDTGGDDQITNRTPDADGSGGLGDEPKLQDESTIQNTAETEAKIVPNEDDNQNGEGRDEQNKLKDEETVQNGDEPKDANTDHDVPESQIESGVVEEDENKDGMEGRSKSKTPTKEESESSSNEDINFEDEDETAQPEPEEEFIDSDEPLPEPGKARITSTSLTLTRDGRTAVVGTSDGWVVFIDLESGKVIGHHKQGQNRVSVALATSSGKYVATAEVKTVVWNTGTCGPAPSDLAEAKDILVVAVAGMECFGFVWNLETKQMIKKLPGLYGFSKVVITSDATKVVTTFFDFPIVMNVEKGGDSEFNMAQMDTMMAGCSCLCLSPDDRLVLSGSTDGSVRVMEIETGKFIFRMQHLSSVKQAAFSPDSRHMITAGFRSILIWSTLDGSLVSSLANHQEFIDCFCFSEDGKFLISGSLDKRIIVWDFKNYSSVVSFTAHCPVSLMKATKDLSAIVYCPENIDYLAIMHPNSALKKIIAGGQLEVPEVVQKAQALALSFSPQSVKTATSRSCAIL